MQCLSVYTTHICIPDSSSGAARCARHRCIFFIEGICINLVGAVIKGIRALGQSATMAEVGSFLISDGDTHTS
jgi:hypothetical protein